jgi:hypothetical protein
MPADAPGLAVHIGADVLASPRHARWPAVRSCRDTLDRTTRLAAAAGITRQRQLLGARASRAEVTAALRRAAAELDPHGHLLLTFTGHSDRERTSPHEPPDIGWCLHDGALPLAEVAVLLAAVPPTALITVIADTCYAAALSAFTVPATMILLAACGANQEILANPEDTFAARLEQLVLPGGQPNPRCTTYRWLHRQLREDSPDVERPRVWTNRLPAWSQRPFQLPASRRSAMHSPGSISPAEARALPQASMPRYRW